MLRAIIVNTYSMTTSTHLKYLQQTDVREEKEIKAYLMY